MSFWAVVRTQPSREVFASERIVPAGFEAFLPQIQTGKRGSAPLFRNYCFVLIVDRWRVIERAFGVLNLVKFGDVPARCPDAEIAALKSMTIGGFIRLPEVPPAPVRRKIAIGAEVQITAGPLAGMRGLYAGQSTRERELVLLNLLGSHRRVEIPASLITPH